MNLFLFSAFGSVDAFISFSNEAFSEREKVEYFTKEKRREVEKEVENGERSLYARRNLAITVVT